MDRIVVDSTVHFGKPCVAGTRITVQDVLELVDQDLPFNRIIQDYFSRSDCRRYPCMHPLCGHDVVRAADLGFARAADEELLKIAQGRDRLFVTRDRVSV